MQHTGLPGTAEVCTPVREGAEVRGDVPGDVPGGSLGHYNVDGLRNYNAVLASGIVRAAW
jgi:hypothetical protein